MRMFVALYLAIGIVLLVLGFFATGPCEEPNNNALNDAIFVVAWPFDLYGGVIRDGMSPTAWLHQQACGGGLPAPKVVVPHSDTSPPPAGTAPKPASK
jgi:hypothetical protein